MSEPRFVDESGVTDWFKLLQAVNVAALSRGCVCDYDKLKPCAFCLVREVNDEWRREIAERDAKKKEETR